MKQRSICIFYLLAVIKLSGQDIIFRNTTNKVQYQLGDSGKNVKGQIIKMDIGPDSLTNANTIFFLHTLKMQHDTLTSVKIKGAFMQNLIFDHCIFGEKSIDIYSTQFDTLIFRNCKFKNGFVFNNTGIKYLELQGNEYPDEISFIACQIGKIKADKENVNKISFIDGQLGAVNFDSTSFVRATFNGSVIDTLLSMRYCNLFNRLSLKGIKLQQLTKLYFGFIRLPDTLDLSYTNYFPPNTEVFFLGYYYGKGNDNKCKLILQNTDIQNINIDYTKFELIFPNLRSDDSKQSVYEALLQNFKLHGYLESYETLDVEYKIFQGHNGSLGWFWWLPYLWYKYGYDKARIFYIALFAVIIFTLYNFFRLNHLVSKVYTVEKIPAFYSKHDSKRLWYAFVYTCIIFFSLSLKLDKIYFNQRRGTLYVMFMYVSGIICLAYMANFVLQR